MNITRFIPATIVASLLVVAAAQAATKTYLIDFGAPGHTPYVFTEGDFGLYNAPTVISQPDTGDHAGFGYKNIRYQLGSAQLAMPMVGAYNLGEEGASTKALIGSFFFSNPGREEVGSPVKFTLTTASRADKVSVSAIGSVQTSQHALITLEGTQVIIDSSETFIPVANMLTGKTSYEGNFATESGNGESNLGGFLITIETP